jgi:NAD(P)-dependent dehydrogenase (short-subunit alcohol dehydrogenase family)
MTPSRGKREHLFYRLDARLRVVKGGPSMKIVVIGGTGLIGSKTVAILRQGGHEVVAAAPKNGVDSITGKGLKEAMAGVQVVIDLANSPSFEDAAVLEFFETSGRNLAAAEAAASVRHQSRYPSSPSTGPTMAIFAPRSPRRS